MAAAGGVQRRAVAAVAALACAVAAVAPQSAAAEQTRYSLVHGCYALQSPGGGYVSEAGASPNANAGSVDEAEAFRMQATALGRYLFYDTGRRFLSVGSAVTIAGNPSNATDLTVVPRGEGFAIVNNFEHRELGVGQDGKLVAVGPGAGAVFGFRAAQGCPRYPEVSLNVHGAPVTGSPSYGEVTGLLEGHLHHMAFEFLGGRAHCGRPWHRFGAPYALSDCPDHTATRGCGAVLENVLYGNPARCHDPVGWPTFNDWPDPRSLTHEQTYYRWVERAWRSGLRVFVMLTVENHALCTIYPLKKNNCNEMKSVELQLRRVHELQDYIDAQSGGPGKGFYRIVTNPFQARRVVNHGKLAVVLGMETSEPFNCGINNENTPFEHSQCGRADIDSWLNRFHSQGMRQLEIVNKFDNGLTGVAGDSGTTGLITNSGNFLEEGSFWDYGPCTDPNNHDHDPTAVHNDDLVIANGLDQLLGTSLPNAPIYAEDAKCNQRGLSDLGAYAVRGIMNRHMIFDPDHMSVLGRNQALDVVEARHYPGVISSHSWSTANALPRIYRLGGVVTPYAGGSESFVDQWQHLREVRHGLSAAKKRRYYFGVGYGADMNGFGSQGDPRGADVPNPVTYPFKSWDGNVTIDQQRSGERLFDINTDGVAQYGLYPDWVQDLRMIAGEKILHDMGRGAEAYLEMWERAAGISAPRCRGWDRLAFDANGLGRRVELARTPRATLTHAGQPLYRQRAWRWCTGRSSTAVAAVFGRDARTELVLSRLAANEAAGVAPGDPAGDLPAGAEDLGGGLWTAPAAGGDGAFVYLVQGGTVKASGVATAALAADPASLAHAVELALP